MEISNSMNQYQSLNMYQKPREELITIPVEPQEPTYKPGEIYDASQGNVISDRDGNLSLTPQGEVNLNNAKDAKAEEIALSEQEQKDNRRATLVDYTEAQSKKSQVEIYLSVASEGEISFNDSELPSILDSLRDVQKQNNAIEAYATYQENQELI